MKYFLLLAMLFITSLKMAAQPKVGDNYGGIIKLTAAAAMQNKNGVWNNADKTGNASIDADLAALNSLNPLSKTALSALESTAAYVRTHPELYVTAAGKIINPAFTDLIRGKYASVSNANLGKYAKLKRKDWKAN